MRLLPDPSLALSPGNFHSVVDGETLKLPRPLFEKLEAHNVHSAAQFVAMCQSAPEAVAMTLDWSLECIEPALLKLTETLEGLVASSILHPGPRVDNKIDEDTMTDEERDLFNNANKSNNTN